MTQQLLSNNELELTKQLLEANMRLDGRSAMKERHMNIEFLNKPGINFSLIKGHLLYHLGETIVLVKSYL